MKPSVFSGWILCLHHIPLACGFSSLEANPSMAMLGCPRASFSDRTDDWSVGQCLTLAKCCRQLTHLPEESVCGEASDASDEPEDESEMASSLFLFLNQDVEKWNRWSKYVLSVCCTRDGRFSSLVISLIFHGFFIVFVSYFIPYILKIF